MSKNLNYEDAETLFSSFCSSLPNLDSEVKSELLELLTDAYNDDVMVIVKRDTLDKYLDLTFGNQNFPAYLAEKIESSISTYKDKNQDIPIDLSLNDMLSISFAFKDEINSTFDTDKKHDFSENLNECEKLTADFKKNYTIDISKDLATSLRSEAKGIDLPKEISQFLNENKKTPKLKY